jgi:hypothetical protein
MSNHNIESGDIEDIPFGIIHTYVRTYGVEHTGSDRRTLASSLIIIQLILQCRCSLLSDIAIEVVRDR